MASNFILVTDEELENLLDCDAENTNKVTKYALTWADLKALQRALVWMEDVNRLHEDELDKLLCTFYTFASHISHQATRCSIKRIINEFVHAMGHEIWHSSRIRHWSIQRGAARLVE